ncbi:DNA cytosine methyltransferase [Kitasatospora sp. NPDC057965]|uniref:DNA cytosine methyltransferase n=1 Tax=Kitasatospora sp. NPDC057965 TaxID=3346291 RepID=UPI0036DE9685
MSSPETTPEFKIVDLFAGPGGLDMAAHVLGVPATGVEWDDNACRTRAAAGLATVQGDVRALDPGHFDANVLAGGPPCQTFTVAGKGAGRQALDQVLDFARRMAKGEDVRGELDALEDERTGLVLEPLRWALDALDNDRGYTTIVLEQVPAVLPVWQEYKRILEARGYSAECDVLHTEEFGVPQTRRRAILIARKRPEDSVLGDVVEFPQPTHRRFHKSTAKKAHGTGLQRWVTMGETLKNVPTPYEVVSNYGTGGDPAARGRRSHDEPAFTVTGKVSRNWLERPGVPVPVPKERERFTLPESGALQTFPANYPWSGKDQAQQIGNAIPPRLGVHVLAAALRRGPEDIQMALKKLDVWGPSTDGPAMYSVDEWKQKVASEQQEAAAVLV